MRNAIKDPKVKFYLGNVRDYDSILPAMLGVDLVFHAAALKQQIPSCEFYPVEAVTTNVLGAENVMKAVHRLRRFSQIDKCRDAEKRSTPPRNRLRCHK